MGMGMEMGTGIVMWIDDPRNEKRWRRAESSNHCHSVIDASLLAILVS